MFATENDLARGCLLPLLERIPAPTFVVREDGLVRFANSRGQARRSREPSLDRELRLAVAGQPTRGAFACTHLDAPGWYLVSATGREGDALGEARARWGLTARQLQVLELVIGGATNRTVAELLDIRERTVEVHLTAIYERTGVENRSSLVSLILRAA